MCQIFYNQVMRLPGSLEELTDRKNFKRRTGQSIYCMFPVLINLMRMKNHKRNIKRCLTNLRRILKITQPLQRTEIIYLKISTMLNGLIY